MTQLSQHFSLEEAQYSSTADRLGLINKAPASVVITMQSVAGYMEVLRNLLGDPIKIDSWYRCMALNRALGSKDTSQHRVGEAVDFICPNFNTPLEICKLIIANKNILPFDQLILEHSWVHISFAILSGKPRGQVLSLLNSGSYSVGLTNPRGIPYN